MNFFKNLLDAKNPLSSKRFISLVSLLMLIIIIVGALFKIVVADIIVVTLGGLVLGSSGLTTINRNRFNDEEKLDSY